MNALARLAPLLLLFVACSPAFSQDDRCGLQLRVLGPDLRPLDGIKGKAVWRGNTVAEGTSVQGTLDFCDIGDKEDVAVVIGPDLCGQTTIGRISIPELRRPLHVIYQNCHAQYYFMSCFVLVRVVDEQGKKIEGAVATIMPGMKTLNTDRFGRFRVQLARKLEYAVSVAKEGLAGALSIPCTLDRETFTQETIVLKSRQ